MGNPAKTLAEHELDGTARADRHAHLEKTFKPGGVPVPPDYLTGEALAHWNQQVPELIERGIAKRCHTPHLVMMCVFWAEWLAWCRGELSSTAMGRVSAMATLRKAYDDKAAMFGLDPITGQKVIEDVGNEEEAEFEFQRGQ